MTAHFRQADQPQTLWGSDWVPRYRPEERWYGYLKIGNQRDGGNQHGLPQKGGVDVQRCGRDLTAGAGDKGNGM